MITFQFARPKMTRLSLSAISLSALVVLSGCSQNSQTSTENAAKKSDQTTPVPVKTVSVTKQDVVRTTTQPATVYPYYRAEIRARVSGYMLNLKADIGDYVKEGAPLAIIDVPEMKKQQRIVEARILRSQAEEKRATAGVELAAAHVRSAEAKWSQAKFEVKRAEALLTAIEAQLLRTKALVQQKALEVRILDEVRKKRDSEKANKDALSSAINSAAAEVHVAQAKLDSAKADFQVTQAETVISQRQLEELNVLASYATLKAPFSGIVTDRTVDPGDLVLKSSEATLFVLSQVDKVRVQVPVPEADAAFVNRGDQLTLTFPSFPAEEKITATVTRMTGSLDPSTRTMLVEAELANPNQKLLPGMFGQATITLSTKIASAMLPARAIRFKKSGTAYVYVVGNDNTVTQIDVTTGFDDGRSIEILSGVKQGQQVVDAHLKRFTTGQKVTILNN